MVLVPIPESRNLFRNGSGSGSGSGSTFSLKVSIPGPPWTWTRTDPFTILTHGHFVMSLLKIEVAMKKPKRLKAIDASSAANKAEFEKGEHLCGVNLLN